MQKRTIRTIKPAKATKETKAVAEEPKLANEVPQVINEMRKRFGNQAIIRGSDQRQPYRIPTGIFMLDMATCGGLPFNQLTMFHGKRSSGKSTSAEKCIAGAQRALPDQQVAHIDVEHTRDAAWGEKLGVDNERLLYVQPDTGEDAVDIVDGLIRTAGISLIVVDSLAALVPNKEVEESVADNATPGLHAKLITRMCRKLTNGMFTERLRGHYVTVLVLNQHRAKIGGFSPHGDPISLPGGHALEHTTLLQVGFKNKENIKKTTGFEAMLEYNEHSFKIDKCKMNAGLRAGEFQLMRQNSDQYELYEGDVDDVPTMLAYAKKIGIYSGGGQSWKLAFPGNGKFLPSFEQVFRSVDEATMFLYANRDVLWHLRCTLIAHHAKRINMPEYFVQYLLGDASGMKVHIE